MPAPVPASSTAAATSRRGDGLLEASVAREPIYDRRLDLVAKPALR